MDASTSSTHTRGTPTRRLAHLYFSPITHCPALCPFGPPAELFLDDYSWAREEAAADHCGRHCGMVDGEPVCLRRQADHDGSIAGRGLVDLVSAIADHSMATPSVDPGRAVRAGRD